MYFLKNQTFALVIFCAFACSSCQNNSNNELFEDEEHEMYDGPAERAQQEFEQTKDPALGRVPIERLWDAMDFTMAQKQGLTTDGVNGIWQERGPIYDSVGPSNGNGRGGGGGFTGAYTSGRMSAVLVDASDGTGNTVFCGGVNGGLWKCTNFMTSADPNWVQINDYLSNMSISSICQDPSNSNILYASTGEGSSNSDAVRGGGIFKSIDHGVTWNRLTATASVYKSFKVLCDAFGNLYYATSGYGLQRSNDGGNTFTVITPSSQSSSYCTDIEFSNTGVLHASFGYGASTVAYYKTSNPSTVTTSSWGAGNSIRTSSTTARRFEIDVKGDTLYGVTTNSSNNIDSCYRSVDGGNTWNKMNTAVYTTSLTNTQGWYNITLAINPKNANQFIVGGLDAYLSTDGGSTISRLSYWVSSAPYVHADHHFIKWWTIDGNQTKLIIASDGGIFYSNNDGLTFVDKNKNLGLKQFYSCAIHPTTTDYFLAGAQDNGTHLLTKPGLSYSKEVTGGDGAYVDIDQDEPQYQFGAYVYNQYRRSTNGGATWSSFNISSSAGSFINQFDYDDVQNVMFCNYGTNVFLRWNNPQTATSTANTDIITLNELNNGRATAITVSPYTTGRVFFGSSTGSVTVVNNSATTIGTGSTDVVYAGQPTSGSINCIAVGSTDNYLLAVYSNYGINNLWYSSNMGATWTAIDGNLPDMPVRWAVFHPTDNYKIVIGTEAGVFSTLNVNGASTQWTVSPGFPLVRVDMLKLRKTDNLLVAATHGRGLWSSNILDVLPLKNISISGNLLEGNIANLNWKMTDATDKANFFVEFSEDGVHYKQILKTNYRTSSYQYKINSDVSYFRVMGYEPNAAPIYSNVVVLRQNNISKGLQIKINPNPVINSSKIFIQSNVSGDYLWRITNVQGSILQSGKGYLIKNTDEVVKANANTLSTGMYLIQIVQNNQTKTSSFIKN
jgi:trimeric autotransporter adhesin